jgi:amidase
MPSSDELAALDATAQADLVRKGLVTPTELVDAAIARAEHLQPVLNCFTTTRFDRAREQAKQTTTLSGPFPGVPTAMKDLTLDVAGEPCHAGSRIVRALDLRPTRNSHHYDRFRRAGLISLGRTNTPEFGNTITTEPLSYGPTRNPWNTNHSTGGSSGGAAAAVAAGIIPVAHATDGGGSIRIPASECGLVGLKPTRGRISQGPSRGEGWAGSTIGHVVTTSVRDCAALLDACHGAEPGDPYAAPTPLQPFVDELGAPVATLRIGFYAGPTLTGHVVHPECVLAVDRAAALLSSLGHHVEAARPDALADEELGRRFVTVLATGTAAEVEALERAAGRPVGVDDLEPENLFYASLGKSITATQYLEAVEYLHAYQRRMAMWWAPKDRDGLGFDVLVTPTIAQPPPPIGWMGSADERPGWRVRMLLQYTSQFNVTGQPAMSLPLHWTSDGLPVGVQFVGGFGCEDVLLRLASQLEVAAPWSHRRPPVHAAN